MTFRNMRLAASAAGVTVWSVGAIARSASGAIAPADVLVTNLDSGVMTDFTPAGAAVQTFQFPAFESGGFHDLRGVAVAANRSSVYLFNGTFTPQLSTLTVSTGAITSRPFTGWDIANNISYGGVGVYGTGVFVNDQVLNNDADGIVRFDTAGGATIRFGTGTDYQDLAIGGNGLLYALSDQGSIDVYSPVTDGLIRSIPLNGTIYSADLRGITASADGTIYGAGWNGSVYALDPSGNILRSLATGDSNLTDIDLNNAGQLLVGSRFGQVIFTDTTLATERQFTVANGPTIHVAFATPQTAAVPEPAAAAVWIALGLATQVCRRNARLNTRAG